MVKRTGRGNFDDNNFYLVDVFSSMIRKKLHFIPFDANYKDILNKLPQSYNDNLKEWYKITCCLKYLKQYDLWNNWSSKSHKYKEHEMVSKWNSFASSKDKISIGTLIHYAKEENIENIYKNNVLTIEDKVKSYPIKPVKLDTSSLLAVAPA